MVSSFFILTILLTNIILLTIYCSYEAQKVRPFKSNLENVDGNLHIYVQNASFYPSANLEVYIDDNKLISKNYPTVGEHSYKKSIFKVEPGTYDFKFYSPDLNLEKSEEINIDDTPWILVILHELGDSQPSFLILKSAKPFVFL